MRRRRYLIAAVLVLTAACGRNSQGAGGSSVTEIRLTASPEEVNLLWKDAEAAYRKGDWSKAAETLERLVLELPPGDDRVPRAHFYLGECYLGMKSHLQAVREFRRVSDEHPNNPLAPLALLRAGDAYAELWRRPELDPTYGSTAQSTYQELLNRYPESDAAHRARTALKDLQEWFALKDLKTAKFYLRYKAYDSAILYLKALVADYPRTSVAPEALEQLVEAYIKLGYTEDVEETCGYMRRFHPDRPETQETCPLVGSPAS